MSLLGNLLGGSGCGCSDKAAFRQGEKLMTAVETAEQKVLSAVDSTDMNLVRLGYETNIRDNTYQCQTLGNVQFGNEMNTIYTNNILSAVQNASDTNFLKSQAMLAERDNLSLRDTVGVLRDEINQLKSINAIGNMLGNQTQQLSSVIQQTSAQNAAAINCDSNRNFASLACSIEKQTANIDNNIATLGYRLQPYPQVQCVAVTPCCGSGSVPASFNQIVPTASCSCSGV